jgi:hypothetical protein
LDRYKLIDNPYHTTNVGRFGDEKVEQEEMGYLPFPDDEVHYTYSEDYWLEQVSEYIEKTYEEHYTGNAIQTGEYIQDQGHGTGFFIGNIIKYASRWGKKEGYNKKDLYKVIHYAIMELNNIHGRKTR